MSANIFFGTSGPQDAKIAIVGEAYGEQESYTNKPFVGESGKLLDKMLFSAGIERNSCFATNVVNARPDKNHLWKLLSPRPAPKAFRPNFHRGLDLLPETRRHVDNLNAQLEAVQPTVILALGNFALWATTNHARLKYTSKYMQGPKQYTMPDGGRVLPSGITDYRGSMLYGGPNGKTPVLPLIHPASILRDWSQFYATSYDIKTRVPKALANDWRPAVPPTLRYTMSFTEVLLQLEALLSKLDDSPAGLPVACDIETLRQTIITTIGFGYRDGEAFTIPFVDKDGGGLKPKWHPKGECQITRLLVAILSHRNIRLIGQNFLYDAQFIWDHWGVRCDVDFDTMTAQHILFPGTPKSLDYLSSLHCKYHWFWKDDNKDWDAKSSIEDHLRYNCEDVVRTWEIAKSLKASIDAEGMTKQWDFAKQRRRLALDLMIKGVKIDVEKRKVFAKEVMLASENRASRLLKIVPQSLVKADRKKTEALWITSDKQQRTLFYDILNLPTQRDKKTGNPSLGKEALIKLEKLAPEFFPIFKCLRDLRSLEVFASTFINSKLDHDLRMRCFYGDVETHRWGSSENAFGGGGNLQNIPSGNEGRDLPNIRSLFVPDTGYTIVDCDLSGADAQVVAWEADDDDLKAAFRSGVKIHDKNATDVFGDEYRTARGDRGDKSTPKGKLYDQNKRAVHATNYGAHWKTLVSNPDIGWTPDRAALFQRTWFSLHPGISNWHQRTNEGLYRDRTVRNRYGYRRVYFDRIDGLLPEALAWGPQSTVALTCFVGALNVRNQHPHVDILLQVHDSLVFQLPTKMMHTLPAVLKSLHNTIPYDDPLIIPWGVKTSEKSWGDVKEWKPTEALAA